ncbi:MBL fold metallo-hydrolase [Alteromonas sp. PRIM-21]|uniref:MBL fold metallo-hydrolase n=1 Tax=Alteromonas sp. PRIM-21 TaxID=1454978 RepID=UPI0022B94B92|nr:MBL fold metallo-hydrolase [Alteromonas sp. PRIM-21]MCZ8530489.1 MBL fold metallo-hydrolase [Alteromonas sp. PRIM-21]
MKIEYVTNASFLFTFSDGTTVLTDPWYEDGIYHGLLFNYPPIHSKQRERYLNLKPDYLYISHIHGDHFNPFTLSHFDKGIPILIGKFPTPALRLALQQLGFTNIKECSFDEPWKLGENSVTIIKEFSGSSDDIVNETNIPVDSSIYLEDKNGYSVFFAVDNPMQIRHAEQIKTTFGKLDAAILAYSGASIYPFVFSHYSDDEKKARVEQLKSSRLKKFCQLAEIIDADFSIPAAGSFVIGGTGYKYAQYQHQACPSEIKSTWHQHKLEESKLAMLSTGDVLDLSSRSTSLSPLALDRDFTQQDRIDYAKSLKNFPCELHSIAWPEGLMMPINSLLFKARANVWRAQEKLSTYPDTDVFLHIEPVEMLPAGLKSPIYAKISMDSERVKIDTIFEPTKDKPYIVFSMTTQVLIALLLGGTFWNVAEYHMTIERVPDQFDPTLRSLMAYFKL